MTMGVNPDMKTDPELARAIKLVLEMGLSTGHADNWPDLVDELLEQYRELRERL